MKALLTGASGFLGTNMLPILTEKFDIETLGIRNKNDLICDLSVKTPKIGSYDLVIHAAGKAHSLPKNEKEVEAFYDVNFLGTKNLIEGLNESPPKWFVYISTVAVYGFEEGNEIDENAPLHGKTAYALSKIKAEREVEIWCKKHNVNFLILRLPLITGKNPPGNLGAMAKAVKKGYYFRVGKAEARRSMVAAQDVAKLICNNNLTSGIYNLTDGIHPSIFETEDYLGVLLGKKIRKLPENIVLLMAVVGDLIPKFPLTSLRYKKLKSTLTFSDKKARTILNWKPRAALNQLAFTDVAK